MEHYGLHSYVAIALLLFFFGGACAVDRTYYIAAVEEVWDYGPGGIDNITGQPFTQNT